MDKHRLSRLVLAAAAVAGAILGLLTLMASMASISTRAAPLDGTGSDPRVAAITVTAELPVLDTQPSAGVTKTVYFSNKSAGVLTAAFEITGTAPLTLTAGAAFDELERVYTASVAPATFVVTYAVATAHTTQPGIRYTATSAVGLSTAVALTYVQDIAAPSMAYGIPPIVASGSGLYAVGATVYYTNVGPSNRFFTLQGTTADALSGPGTVGATPALGTASPSNAGDWANWAFTYMVRAGGVDTASGQITVAASDALGNGAVRVFTYTHDPLPPTGGITVAGGAAYVDDPDVALALSAADNLTGCGVVEMCVGEGACSSWEPYAASDAWTFSAGDGMRTITVRYRDRLGNTSAAYADTVFLDTASPLVTVMAPPVTSTLAFSVTWASSDPGFPTSGSGVISYTVHYNVDSGIWQTWHISTTLTQDTFVGAVGHTYVFSVTAEDRAGNRGQGVASTQLGEGWQYVYLPLAMKQWAWWYQYDIYEPNDTRDQAYGLPGSGSYTSYIYVADDQRDYYAVTAASNGTLVIDLAVPVGCDYDLYLYDSLTGTFVAASNYTGKGLDESIVYGNAQAGVTYYILVYSPYRDYSSQDPYGLDIALP